MGHSSKKKKKGGSGRRNKGRATSKDHGSNAYGDGELLAEEITALCAIFQEECKVVSDSPPQIIIKLRPYTKDMGYEDLDISALLLVRYLPGYPYKCPKLQIIPEKGLTEADIDNLLSLLQDQANSNAREGRVMIYNLVEAAQEFLSEIVPISQSKGLRAQTSSQLIDSNPASSRGNCTGGPFVYGFIDLFGGSGAWNWNPGFEDNSKVIPSVNSSSLVSSKVGHENQGKEEVKSFADQAPKQGALFSSISKLEKLKEESAENKSIPSSDSNRSKEEVELKRNEDEKNIFQAVNDSGDDESSSGSGSSQSRSLVSLSHDQVSQCIEKDLLIVHLLRLSCASKGPLADVLPQIATELKNLGMLSEEMWDLASKPSPIFNETFERVFHHYMVSSKVPQFWEPTPSTGQPSTSLLSSRYLNDFEELKPLGHGGFGHVVLCKNKLDGRQYAVKQIRLKDKSLPMNDRILREVATLSRLQHQHVVRYYQAWVESGADGSFGDTIWGSETAASSIFSHLGAGSSDVPAQDNKLESTYLYIQMEYCPRTLRQHFESYNHLDKDLAWHLFRQIVEGLVHIHGQGIIHRDLTPNNIFFDARNEIKIGDFGLAKFLKLEQLDQDGGFPPDVTGVSIDGTGRVGTYFYTAPEIEQGWPKIDEMADMFSLGVVFFELWHPFGTEMERHIVLSDLKHKGELPSAWAAEFPEQAALLKRLMSPIPSNRPSAIELRHAFPPRLESELLDNIIRTMQTSDDSSVYEKVVNAIFDDEMIELRSHHQHSSRLNISADDSSTIQYPELETEVRDYVVETTREICRRHCAKHLEIIPMHLLDARPQFNRNTFKLLTHGGDMLELCHELRLPFVQWVVAKQKSSLKRYEISAVYRKAIGHSPPNHYLQGDFDIIGGEVALTEAEVLKVVIDIITNFFPANLCNIHLNHGGLLDAIWSWAGIPAEHRHKVAELLSMMGSLRPQSSERKLRWKVIRRQLLQELDLPEGAVNRLQTVGLRFCGAADQALPRLRGALPAEKSIRKALDDLSDLLSHLRVWRIEENVYVDALMPPTEIYHRDLFFQVFLSKESNSGALVDGSLLAIGGRYDYLLHQMCDRECKTSPPGAVGASLALETIIQHSRAEFRPVRNEASTSILVCSRGGGGMLIERMDLVAELWEKNIKAEFVPKTDPSLTEQYEYASEHDIKCLVIINSDINSDLNCKVRLLEHKREKEVSRAHLVKFLLDAMATQFRNPSHWI